MTYTTDGKKYEVIPYILREIQSEKYASDCKYSGM